MRAAADELACVCAHPVREGHFHAARKEQIPRKPTNTVGTWDSLPAVATGIAWLHQQTMTRDEEQVQGCALYAGSFQQGVSCCFAQAKD